MQDGLIVYTEKRGDEMATISEIQGWIWSYQQTVNSCDNQIARLNSVYKELGNIKSSFRRTRNDTERIFKEKVAWRGEMHMTFCNGGVELDGILGEYYRQLDAAQDEVNKKIAQLKAKKWELIPIINSLVAQIQDLKSDVENALN